MFMPIAVFRREKSQKQRTYKFTLPLKCPVRISFYTDCVTQYNQTSKIFESFFHFNSFFSVNGSTSHLICFMNHYRMSPAKHTPAHSIPPHAVMQLAKAWLAEDTPNFDPAGVCVGSQEVEARLLCKSPHSILAGSPFFTAVFTEVGCNVDWIYQDGDEIGQY